MYYVRFLFVGKHHLVNLSFPVSSTILHGANGQSLSPKDIVEADVLDNGGLDFSGDTYPVRIRRFCMLGIQIGDDKCAE